MKCGWLEDSETFRRGALPGVYCRNCKGRVFVHGLDTRRIAGDVKPSVEPAP